MSKLERTFIVVDLENACGGSNFVPLHHSAVLRSVMKLSPHSPPLIIFSTGPKALALTPDLLWEWSIARYVPGHGLNGADNALLRVLREEPVAMRSSRVILVSGDHVFAESVAFLRELGIRTTVLAPYGALSHRLAEEAFETGWLPVFGSSATSPLGLTDLRKSA